METTRREALNLGLHGLLASVWLRTKGTTQPSAPSALWGGYPRQDLKVVAEVVGASHFDEKRVRELVKGYPELVNAWWDWGYGDWESPLGAASHVGDRGIAEFLLESGARIDIFAAAMLGQTKVVQSFVEARPGTQKLLGPHNITLLSHAEAGGKQAAETVEYLKELGNADNGPKAVDLDQGAEKIYLGEYKSEDFGLRMVCRLNRNQLLVADFFTETSQSTGRLLRCTGGHAFFPAGAPSVKVQFSVSSSQAGSVSISDSVPELTLTRLTTRL